MSCEKSHNSVCEQQRFRRACLSAQVRHNLCCSLTLAADICAHQRLRSACASEQFDQSTLPAWRNCVLGYPKCAQWRFWSNWANAQADLDLHWARMTEDAFFDVASNQDLFSLWAQSLKKKTQLSQRTTKPTIRPVWPAKTQISRYIHPVWQGFSFIPVWIARRHRMHIWSAKTLIRLRGCAIWSESSLVAQV